MKMGVRGNPAEYSSPSRPSQRDTFFGDMANLNFNELASKYAKVLLVRQKD